MNRTASPRTRRSLPTGHIAVAPRTAGLAPVAGVAPVVRLAHVALAVLLALAVSGCKASRAYFRPAERTIVETADRVAGAQFDLRDGQGRQGELRVWCVHAEEVADPADRTRRSTYVDIGLELENHSKEDLKIVVGDARLRDVQTKQRRIDSVVPFEPGETLRVSPASVATTYLTFELPPGVRPGDIRTFRLQWLVSGAGKRRFTDFTSFVRGRWRGYDPGYYGAGPYPGWGFSFGYPGSYWGWCY